MTDEIIGSGQSQSQSTGYSEPTSSSAISPSVSSVSERSVESQKSPERTFTQQELNEIVGRAKKEAVERHNRANDSHSNSNANSSMSHDDVRRLAAEEAQRLRDQWVSDSQRQTQEQEAYKVANEFFNKMSSGKEKYEDFEKVTGQIGFQNIPDIVQLANSVDNTADVMYELAKNPMKIASIKQLVSISPNLAYNEMMRLSQSIKDNASAQTAKNPNNPLSQLKPSNAGADNGVMTASDYRRKYRA